MKTTKYIVYWARFKNMTNPYEEGYIGVTKQKLKERIRGHYNSSTKRDSRFYEILKSNKRNDIVWSVLGYAPNAIGAYTIEKFFRTNINNTWNSTEGGGGWCKHNEEINRKLSKANTGENNHMYGKKQSEEVKNKISNSLKKHYLIKENRDKLKGGKIGRKHTIETKLKISKANKGRVISKDISDRLRELKTDKTKHMFYHKEYGYKHATKIELCDEFFLEPSNLRHVIAGRRPSHKGWTLAKKVD